MDEKEKELKKEEALKEIMLSVIEDYSKALDQSLKDYNMMQCMYNLGYATYFVNRGLNDKDVLKRWKEVQDKAFEIGKKIEQHNIEEIQKAQKEKDKKEKKI